jgi:hypothetical protein
MVEQVTLNHRVGGSIPSQPTLAGETLAAMATRLMHL